MKKKIIAIFMIFIILIVIFVFAKNKLDKAKVEYELVSVENYNYVKYRNNEKYGVIDRQGNIIIEAKYSDIQIPNPEKPVFICYENENNIVLDANGKTLFEEYDKIEPIKLKNIASTLCYEKSVLKYQKDGLYGLVTIDGKQITKNKYTSIENLQGTEGKLIVGKDGKYGIINIKGKTLVDIKYDHIDTDNYYTEETKYIEAGFIVSRKTDDGYRYGYVNYQGKKILDEQFNDVIRVTKQKDIYLIVAKNGRYGFYKGNKELIKPEYQSIVYTDNGGIIIEKNKQFGIANIKGDIKVDTKYLQIQENGIYLYAQDSSENEVYSVEGDKVDISFNKCVYRTENENYNITTILNNDITFYGIENNEGIELVATNYKYIEYIYGDYFIAENQEGKYGVIDYKGNTIVEFGLDLIQKIKNKNIVQALLNGYEEIRIYSFKMEKILTMKSAKIKNEKNHIKVYNKKQNIYLDKDGNRLEESSDIIQEDIRRELPDKIKDYEKRQYSLDDVYYE